MAVISSPELGKNNLSILVSYIVVYSSEIIVIKLVDFSELSRTLHEHIFVKVHIKQKSWLFMKS